MATKIHYPITEVTDQTGLRLCGRHADGRYQYRNMSLLHRSNVIALTHRERIGLALCKKIARMTRPGVDTRVYVLTKDNSAVGWGTFGQAQLWLSRATLGCIGGLYLAGEKPRTLERAALTTLAHEMGHNTQATPSKPHGREFDRAHAKMRHAMVKILRKGWKVDLRKMRDSVAPHLAKKAAKAQQRKIAANETLEAKWQRKLANAERHHTKWRKAKEKAEKLEAKWHKETKRAARFLERASAKAK